MLWVVATFTRIDKLKTSQFADVWCKATKSSQRLQDVGLSDAQNWLKISECGIIGLDIGKMTKSLIICGICFGLANNSQTGETVM